MLRWFERLLLLWLVLSSGLAYVWPEQIAPLLPEGWRFDPFHPDYSGVYLNYLLAAAMLAIGWMLPRDEVEAVLRNWPAVLSGTAIQYTAMPLLAFSFATLLELRREYFIGVILVGCVPGAMASNVVTLAARGNTSYSVMLTTCSTILSPLAVPLGLYLTLGAGGGDWWLYGKAALFLLLTVVIPVTLGHLAARQWPQFEETAKVAGSLIANLTILIIIAAVVGSNRKHLAGLLSENFVAQGGVTLLVALAAINLLGYVAGYCGGWLLGRDEPMRRALTIEIGMQNAGLGALLAKQLFPSPADAAAQIPPALFTFGCMFTGTLLATAWAAWDDYRAARGDEERAEGRD